MKIKKNQLAMVALLLFLLTAQSIFAKDNGFDCSKIEDKTARAISSAIANSGIVVFSKDNLIKSGISLSELNSWNTQIECYNSFALKILKDQPNGGYPNYSNYVNQLKTINDYIQKTINQLNLNYSSVYSRDDGIVFKQLLRQGALKNLPKVVNKIMLYLEMVSGIASTVLKNLINSVSPSNKWKSSVKADPNLILSNYKSILKSYSSRNATAFLNKYAKTSEDAQSLMSKLEKLEYRLVQMSQNEIKEKVKKDLEDLAQIARTVIMKLREEYPLVLTEEDIDKVDASPDKVNAIVLGQADAFSGILANLLKNVKELLAAAKK